MRVAPFVAGLGLLLSGLSGLGAAERAQPVVSAGDHNFGTIKQGEKVVHSFSVRNEGTAPLRILAVDLSQPGMTARFKHVILAREEVPITVEWNTEQVTGEVEGQIRVRFDQPAEFPVLVLKGVVKPPIEIIPYAAAFFSVYKGEGAERRVRIVNNEERPFNIARVEPDGQHFTASLETIEPGRVFELVVQVPPETPSGRYREAVYLRTDHPTRSRIRVAVNVFVKADLYASPELVDFGTVSLAEFARAPSLLDFLTQVVILRKRVGEFEIKSIVSDLPVVRISQEPAGASRAFRVDVGLVRERLQAGRLTGSIRILTNDEEFPELVIPVRGELR
jgi:uncharacterized membrane protein